MSMDTFDTNVLRIKLKLHLYYYNVLNYNNYFNIGFIKNQVGKNIFEILKLLM